MPHDHEPVEHKAQHREAGKIFRDALVACMKAEICPQVAMQEMTEILVQTMLAHEMPLAEAVAGLIETYEETRDFVKQAVAEKVLKPAGGPQ